MENLMKNFKANIESYSLKSDSEALSEIKECKDLSLYKSHFKGIVFSNQDTLKNIEKKKALLLYLGLHKAKRAGLLPTTVNHVKVRLKRHLLQEVDKAA